MAVRAESWATSDRQRLGGPGHHQQAGGAPVQPVHDARAQRVPVPGQRRQVRVAGQQPGGQGAVGPAGAGVHHQARRLVHHHELAVLVDHLEGHLRVGHQARIPGTALHHQRGPGPQGLAPRRGHGTVHPHPAAGHQLGRPGPRDAGQHRHRPVHPHPVHQRRHRDLQVPGPGHRGLPAPRQKSTARATTPTVMQASATLNVGQ